ncbi:MAG: twin-arginine translocation signal domain-containing protein [Mycobacterium sp.]|nr:twin-arginine translocation signal domain-containing protein [Mycobacterium sp.]
MNRLSRRSFLYGTALAAGSITLGACSSDGGTGDSAAGTAAAGKGSAKKPLPAPKSFHDAPALAHKGLPPVAQRLPEHPYVIPHNWVAKGKYGGTLNMVAFSSNGVAGASSIRQFFYGHSPLRWLNDGLDIGPGLAESWSSNADASEWTLHFRKGLKWSDGQPFTTEDILFWWEDLVVPGHFAQVPPDDCRSGKNTLVKMTAVDETTLTMTFDAPAPLTGDRIAMWPNGGTGKNGPIWVLPKHYCKQFHPKYNPKVPKNWDTVGGLWETKTDWMRNPDCPTLIGYRCKSFDNNSNIVLERNPYYYAVSKTGDQLPYIDQINIKLVQDAQVIKLQVQQGTVDYCHGPYNQIDVADVANPDPEQGQG